MRPDHPYLLARHPPTGPGAPRAIDLFSGAGGITLGLRAAGFRVVLASDIDAACADTHRANLPDVPFECGDVRRLTRGRVESLTGLRRGQLDLLVGGPPCQGFSIIGSRDVDDPRNDLFREFIRLARALRPRCILMENVPGLATLRRGRVLAEIGAAFDSIGYRVTCAELLAAQYGVPQMRWRIVFIAWPRRSPLGSAGFPPPTHGHAGIGDLVPNRSLRSDETEGFLTTTDAIADLPPLAAGGVETRYAADPARSYHHAMRHEADDRLHNHYAPRLSETTLARIRCLSPGQDWRDLPRELLPESMKRARLKDHTRRYRRMTWDGTPRSIITRFRDPKSGEYTHPSQDRTISIREAARIQSFPDWFAFTGTYSQQYDQVGNAVPPLLAKALGRCIREALAGRGATTEPPKSRYRIPRSLRA